MMDVSFYGMVYGVKAVLPLMVAAQSGTIVNMGSSVSQAVILSDIAGYTAAKSAIDGFTQTLQMELQGTPVNVVLVRPTTVVGTDFLRKHIPPSGVPRMTDFISLVTPPQVAHAVIAAIRHQRTIVDLPLSNALFYWLFRLMPGFVRWLVRQGGAARRDYREIAWQYKE
jgi:short-subunit dehydrogenase